jgi:hypothetical protein
VHMSVADAVQSESQPGFRLACASRQSAIFSFSFSKLPNWHNSVTRTIKYKGDLQAGCARIFCRWLMLNCCGKTISLNITLGIPVSRRGIKALPGVDTPCHAWLIASP